MKIISALFVKFNATLSKVVPGSVSNKLVKLTYNILLYIRQTKGIFAPQIFVEICEWKTEICNDKENLTLSLHDFDPDSSRSINDIVLTNAPTNKQLVLY